MNQMEAIKIIENLTIALQRYRSNAAMEIGHNKPLYAAAKDVQKWTLGSDELLTTMIRIGDQQICSGNDFYNMMYIAHNLAPELTVAYTVIDGDKLPEPDIAWLIDKEWFNGSDTG